MQEFTQYNGARPFGVSFIFAQMDEEPILYSIDPAGSINRWKGKSFGKKEDAINSALQGISNKDLIMEEGLKVF